MKQERPAVHGAGGQASLRSSKARQQILVQKLQVGRKEGSATTHESNACSAALLMAHLDAAYNLARWLGLKQPDAEDLVQEAYLRAFTYFGSFRGGNLRGWFLTIVRNCFYDRLRKSGVDRHGVFDETLHSTGPQALDPEASLLADERNELVRTALEELPLGLREVLVLSEFEEMSYKEIANVAGIPLGTVMSRLSRARRQVQQKLQARVDGGEKNNPPVQHQTMLGNKNRGLARISLLRLGSERGT